METGTLVFIFYTMLAVFALWAIWLTNRPTRKIDGGREYKSTIIAKKDKRFNENQEFCPYCLTNNYFYRGGGSWAPDRCSCQIKRDAGGVNHRSEDEVDFILWKQMNIIQRDEAAERFQRMWKDMHGTDFKFTVYDE